MINYIFIQYFNNQYNTHLLYPKTVSRNKTIVHGTIIQEHTSILT